MKYSKEYIINVIPQNGKQLCSFEITYIDLFCSYTKKIADDKSDIDYLVKF